MSVTSRPPILPHQHQKGIDEFSWKLHFLGNYTKKNDLLHVFIASFIKKSIFYYVASSFLEG